MALISVQIRMGGSVILPWNIVGGFSEACSMIDLYDTIKNGTIDLGTWSFPDKLRSASVTVCVGRNKSDTFDKVMPTMNVLQTTRLFGHYVRYDIESDTTTGSRCTPTENMKTEEGKESVESENRTSVTRDEGHHGKNAFEILLSTGRKLILPEPFSEDASVKNNKRVLFNRVLSILERAGLGFTHSNLDLGRNFLQAITNCLWVIDPHLDTLTDRGFHVPLVFEHLTGYNIPEKHKHKKESLDNMTILHLASTLDKYLEQPWMSGPMWLFIKTAVKKLSDNLHNYSDYLTNAAKRMHSNRTQMFPVRSEDEGQSIEVLFPKYVIKPGVSSRYKGLVDHLAKMEEFNIVCIDEYTPENTRQRRYYLENIKHGLPYKCMHVKFTAGNNLGSHNFIWRVPCNTPDSEMVEKNTEIVQRLKRELPSFHTRAMRRAFIQKASLICDIKAKHARYIYKHLVGDSSDADTADQKEIDARVHEAFEMQDPDIITDLRHHNQGQPSKYHEFFDQAKQYLENVVETAVDDRRHDRITHLAQAISVPDLLRQVKDKCPPETPIPSEQWIRLQFAPKNPSSYTSLQYTGKLKVKFQVQSRQLRKTHVDTHYASAVFRYLKDFSVMFRDHAILVCMDDKHHCKVGEPGHPVAAVDRGKRVVVAEDVVFAVADHDFTKFSIVPSVTMLVDIPESVTEGSFYRGQVYVGVKDLVLEPSTPLRHIAELKQILIDEGVLSKPILCLYTDGGPDHRVTYLSVQLALVCLFLSGNFDMVVAARTPPMASWKNPPERVMSILNLALQAVGLMRSKVSDDAERKMKSANGLKKLREIASDPVIHQELKDSIEPVKILLTQMFRRLYLKDKQFRCFSPASEEVILDLWHELDKFGEPLGGDMTQKGLKNGMKERPELQKFLDHCTVSRSYFFAIRKCGVPSCHICEPPRLPPDVFAQLKDFPDPIPGDDGHYKGFDEVYGSTTTEEHRPSLRTIQGSAASGHGMPFSPSAQTTKTVKLTVTCVECDKPRVLYCATKLSTQELAVLKRVITLYQYSCGSELQELKPEDPARAPRISDILDRVFVRANLTCTHAVEIPYFSSGVFPPVCYHCADSDVVQTEGTYPVCARCETVRDLPFKRKHVQQAKDKKNKKKK